MTAITPAVTTPTVLPVPAGRGRWRLTAYNRSFSSSALPVPIADLSGARGRRLTKAWDTPASFTFTLAGDDPAALAVVELATDVIAWRWDEPSKADVPMFHGLVDHSEDQISEQSATVTFTAHDYVALLNRRILTSLYNVTGTDQDVIVTGMMNRALLATSSGGTSFTPGNYLPLQLAYVNPDGTTRAVNTGQLRDRTYPAQTVIGHAIDDLAKVINGFDYDVLPTGPATTADLLRIFYPRQGVDRTADMAFVYGTNVATVARTVSSADYANYVRVLGNNGSADPLAAQLYAETWNADSNNVTVNPVGLWQTAENAADVTIPSTLADKAGGDLAYQGLLTPSYVLGLRPNGYAYGYPNMGDTVPLFVSAGRLNVATTVRVIGLDYSIGDNGDEDVTVTVGRPPATIAKRLSRADRDINALVRR